MSPKMSPKTHALLERGMAMLIIGATLARIRQDFPGFLRLLELDLGFLVAIVAIRMMLHRQTAIGLLQIIFRRRLVNTKNLVVIALAHAASVPNVLAVLLTSSLRPTRKEEKSKTRIA